mmetsp:Transcript_56772/g.65050  ORF Transcript_56772/g.65050 Transcript_56772/m.65050 type:complete len:168 (-) Transcript_56772:171-674(-)
MSQVAAHTAVDQKVVDARAKLAEKFGDSTRLGGAGTQRRKKKVVAKTTVTSDKNLKGMIKKFNVQPVPDIAEVNMFKNDDTVIHFKHPEVLASIPSNTFVVCGKGEEKKMKDLLPDIITHLGPKQFKSLSNLFQKPGAEGIKESTAEEEEDVPNLVNQDFEKASNKN